MNHHDLIEHVRHSLATAPALNALFLGGSHGQGQADRFSDIDFIALAEAEHHEALAAKWRTALEDLAPVVFWSARQGAGGYLVNAILADWTRCDLYLRPVCAFSGRARNTVQPLIDPGGIWDTLPPELPGREPDARRVSYIIHEFIRVLGLTPVGADRGEYVLLVRGTGILRDLLSDLMIEECPLPERGGALHPSRLMSAQDMAELAALPCPAPDRDAVIAANIAISEAFFPRARRIAARVGLDWPDAFETATRQYLERELGMRFA
ncbi:MAG: nucleotidyltransferase domain-containing protein [Albidovulum sp.]|uniref:nucleotidyltransferase domain-containing protein n=1 Tax=Albidovulum sp. TaxID=1872424 RepID=UPI003CAEABD5